VRECRIACQHLRDFVPAKVCDRQGLSGQLTLREFRLPVSLIGNRNRTLTNCPVIMSLFFGVFVLSGLLLALDLWTAPKPAPTPPGNLKD
jgi:hypothetical protein